MPTFLSRHFTAAFRFRFFASPLSLAFAAISLPILLSLSTLLIAAAEIFFAAYIFIYRHADSLSFQLFRAAIMLPLSAMPPCHADCYADAAASRRRADFR
jgi:hypothetical protein